LPSFLPSHFLLVAVPCQELGDLAVTTVALPSRFHALPPVLLTSADALLGDESLQHQFRGSDGEVLVGWRREAGLVDQRQETGNHAEGSPARFSSLLDAHLERPALVEPGD